MNVWAIVVAGGSSTRFGAQKQVALLGGRRVVDRSLETAGQVCQGTVAVLAADSPEVASGSAVAGGSSRSSSVRNGLAAVPSAADVIVVHDAARPLASPDLFRAVIAAVEAGADGAIPGVPVTDTIKRVAADGSAETLDREALVAVQTPQAFRAAALREAHRSGAEATDDAGLVERAGGRIVIVPGEDTNIKITVAADLVMAEALLTGTA